MSGAAVADIRLSCEPGKEKNDLVFSYKLENQGKVAAYVMDAVATIDGASGLAKPNFRSVVVLAGPEEAATVGKFMPPLPTDRRIAVPLIPLARPLDAGATLQGRIEIPLPLAETSPYFADLSLRQYAVVEIKAVLFTIGYWLAGIDGLVALPLEGAPELCTVTARNTLRSARHLSQRFSVRSLQFLTRTDQFPRNIPGATEAERS